jgi:hypothetical protein
LLEPDYPLVAVEVRPRAVGVVRCQRQGGRIALCAAVAQELPEGAWVPSMSEPNLAAPDAFRSALRAALERAGAASVTRACLVLPDPAARVALLPAGELIGKRRAEADALVRFRLKKSLPFDVQQARLAYALPSAADAGASVPVVAIAGPVLDQYEELLQSAGLHAGLVELSGLVCLAAATRDQAADDRLVVNWDDGYVSLLLTHRGRLALVRTLVGDAAARPDDVQRETFNTVLYHRERLGGSSIARVLVRAAALPAEQALALLREPLEREAQPFDPWAATSPTASGGDGGGAVAVPPALAPALAALLARAA